MPQYRFVVDGDFVDFYDGTQHVIRVRNTTQDVDWFYTTAPGIAFELDGLKYKTENANEIEIDGVTLSANTEFDAAIVAIFPNLAGGESGGGVTTVGDPVSASNAKGAVITGSSIALYNANTSGPGMVTTGAQGFAGDKTFNGVIIANSQLRVQDDMRFRSQNASGFFAFLSAPVLTADRSFTVPDEAGILATREWVEGQSDSPGETPGIDDVLAEGQALTAEREIFLNGNSFSLRNGTGEAALDLLLINIDEGGTTGYLRSKSANGLNRGEVNPASSDAVSITQMWASFNNDERIANVEIQADGTESFIRNTAERLEFVSGGEDIVIIRKTRLDIDTLDGTGSASLTLNGAEDAPAFEINISNGDNTVSIEGEAVSNVITHNAGTHTFNTGDIVITTLAGGGTTGLSIDDNGKIIRTP